MAQFRKIHTRFWTDSFIESLTPEQKYFFLYLLTNERTRQCGIYEITLNQISYGTGYNLETVKKLLDFFEKSGKIKFSVSTNEIAVKNWQKYNGSESPSVKKYVNQELKEVKNSDLTQWVHSVDTVVPLTPQKEEEREGEEERENIPDKTPDGDFAVEEKIVGIKPPDLVNSLSVTSPKKEKKASAAKKEKVRNPDTEPYWAEIRKKWIWFNRTHLKFDPEPIPKRDYSHIHRIIEALRARAVTQAVPWTQETALSRWEKFLDVAYTRDDFLSKNFLPVHLESKMQKIFSLIENPNGTTNAVRKNSTIGKSMVFDKA